MGDDKVVDWLEQNSSETSDDGSEQASEQTTSTEDNQDLSYLAQVPVRTGNGGSWGEFRVFANSGHEPFDGREDESEWPGIENIEERAKGLWGNPVGAKVAHYIDDPSWFYVSFQNGSVPNQGHMAVEGNGSLDDLLEHVQEQTESADGFRISTSGPNNDLRYIEALANPDAPEEFNIWVADPEHEDYRRNGELLNEGDESYDIDDYSKEIANALDDDKHVRVNLGGEAEFKTDVPKVISYLSNEHPETAIVDSNTEGAQSDNPLLSQPDGYISVAAEPFKNPGSDEPQQTSSDSAGGPVSTLYELIK